MQWGGEYKSVVTTHSPNGTIQRIETKSGTLRFRTSSNLTLKVLRPARNCESYFLRGENGFYYGEWPGENIKEATQRMFQDAGYRAFETKNGVSINTKKVPDRKFFKIYGEYCGREVRVHQWLDSRLVSSEAFLAYLKDQG